MATVADLAILARPITHDRCRRPLERDGILPLAWCGALVGSMMLWVPALALVRAAIG